MEVHSRSGNGCIYKVVLRVYSYHQWNKLAAFYCVEKSVNSSAERYLAIDCHFSILQYIGSR